MAATTWFPVLLLTVLMTKPAFHSVDAAIISKKGLEANVVLMNLPKGGSWKTSNSTVREIRLHRTARAVDDDLSPPYDIYIERPASSTNKYIIRVVREGDGDAFTSIHTYVDPWKYVSAASASEGRTSQAICELKISRNSFAEKGQTIHIPNHRASRRCDRFAVSFCHELEHEECFVDIISGLFSGKLSAQLTKESISERGIDRLVPGRKVFSSDPKKEPLVGDIQTSSYNITIERLVSDKYEYAVRVDRAGTHVYKREETFASPWRWVSAVTASEGSTILPTAICEQKVPRRSFNAEGQTVRIYNLRGSLKCDHLAISFCLDMEETSCAVLVVSGFFSGKFNSTVVNGDASQEGQHSVPSRAATSPLPEKVTPPPTTPRTTSSTTPDEEPDEELDELDVDVSYNVTVKWTSQKYFIRVENEQKAHKTTLSNKDDDWFWISAAFYTKHKDGLVKECKTFISRQRIEKGRAIDIREVKSKCPVLGISLCVDEAHNSCYVEVFDKILYDDLTSRSVKEYVSETGYRWIPGRGLQEKAVPYYLQIARVLKEVLSEKEKEQETESKGTVCGIASPVGPQARPPRSSEPEPLIALGSSAKLSSFPWHVGVFEKPDNRLLCGGTLVKANLVISAAHCFYDDEVYQLRNKSIFFVAAGKLYRNFSIPETNQQVSAVTSLIVPERYRGRRQRFEFDLALLVVNFTINSVIRPACVDWSGNSLPPLRDGETGLVAGWGLRRSNLDSDSLRFARMSFIMYERCDKITPDTFLEYVTGDKFCAGNKNGATVRKGDSGGGLTFLKESNRLKQWYLRGVVSTGPDGELTYTAFADVGKILPVMKIPP